MVSWLARSMQIYHTFGSADMNGGRLNVLT